ncbi:hypothetical protein [Auritidibacter ignavus]|uniref:hypothetical protein n=1 Tax=Auritidibacter ignavus TaxID=678932 RepID=UPI00109CBA80|nr:hypothetical protein [Auritidibacter ignavus]
MASSTQRVASLVSHRAIGCVLAVVASLTLSSCWSDSTDETCSKVLEFQSVQSQAHGDAISDDTTVSDQMTEEWHQATDQTSDDRLAEAMRVYAPAFTQQVSTMAGESPDAVPDVDLSNPDIQQAAATLDEICGTSWSLEESSTSP